MKTDLLIIGAGPAGLAAAFAASKSGLNIDIVDDNFQSGGQIWRGGAPQQSDVRARDMWLALSQAENVRFHFQSKLIQLERSEENLIATVEHNDQQRSSQIAARRLIIATGARELLLPFPGWTLPGITGAGGLQALAKNGYPVKGKKVVVAGTGPLLLAVAATLTERGAIVTHILEQASLASLSRFALGLLRTPTKLKQAFALGWKLKATRYLANSFVIAAEGKEQVATIRVSNNGDIQEFNCDLLACAYGLLPNLEIAAALGCAIENDDDMPRIKVDQWQQTNLNQVYCAGETTGIGGVDLAIAEGSIAGYAASDQRDLAIDAIKQRAIWQGFAERLKQGFALRSELRHLCQKDTIVCRCEDVRYAQLQDHADWRSAKLHTRCGMGACQGRICGNANRFLFSWERDLGRLPLHSCNIGHLIDTHIEKADSITSMNIASRNEQEI